jgi:hypothetical protein
MLRGSSLIAPSPSSERASIYLTDRRIELVAAGFLARVQIQIKIVLVIERMLQTRGYELDRTSAKYVIALGEEGKSYRPLELSRL